jgi:hypothetical protein
MDNANPVEENVNAIGRDPDNFSQSKASPMDGQRPLQPNSETSQALPDEH